MADGDAGASGRFAIGGDMEVVRLGFGAMRITGDGIWGAPRDRAEAIRVLRRLPEVGIDFVDTADSYGPFVSEALIREALHPYDGLVVATKGGLVRHGPDIWAPVGRPEYLRQCVLMSLRRLGVERIDLWQLHRVDPKVPADEQFGAIAAMRAEGLIRHAGLSQVGVAEIEAASRFFPVATVQNRFSLADRSDAALVDRCERAGIGFVPWAPLAAGALARPGGPVDRIAAARGVPASHVALGWMLQRSPAILPIPGTGRVAHLEENVRGASLRLSEDERRSLDQAASAG